MVPFVGIYAMDSGAYSRNSNSNDNLGLVCRQVHDASALDCMAWQRSTAIGLDGSPQIEANGHCGSSIPHNRAGYDNATVPMSPSSPYSSPHRHLTG